MPNRSLALSRSHGTRGCEIELRVALCCPGKILDLGSWPNYVEREQERLSSWTRKRTLDVTHSGLALSVQFSL